MKEYFIESYISGEEKDIFTNSLEQAFNFYDLALTEGIDESPFTEDHVIFYTVKGFSSTKYYAMLDEKEIVNLHIYLDTVLKPKDSHEYIL